jgi:23S rRNA pseudouridine2605 synthase
VAERLQKYLATAGVASRRACETLIESGRIKVNGIVVKTLGTSVEPGEDVVDFDGRRIEPERLQVYLMVNKPIGYISAASDPEGRPVVTSLVPPEYGRVYPVGRLDWDTEGAVILTNDGELTQLLTHPRHEVAKIYQAKLRGIVDNMDPRIERLRQGVMLDDGYVTLPADVIRDSDTGNHTWFVVGIREGKNRQIRRMFEAVPLPRRRLGARPAQGLARTRSYASTRQPRERDQGGWQGHQRRADHCGQGGGSHGRPQDGADRLHRQRRRGPRNSDSPARAERPPCTSGRPCRTPRTLDRWQRGSYRAPRSTGGLRTSRAPGSPRAE